MTLTTQQDVAGLPASLLSLAAQAAREAGASGATPEHGPWRITLDFPSFAPFLEHSQRRDLRETLYRAFISRASTGPEDNTPLINRILQLRQEQAVLLGYRTYAELSLASKMAPDVTAVERLLEELRQASLPQPRRIWTISKFLPAPRRPEASDLCLWDVAFWAERLREHRYAFNDEELRPYFLYRACSTACLRWPSVSLGCASYQPTARPPCGIPTCAFSASTTRRATLRHLPRSLQPAGRKTWWCLDGRVRRPQ